MDADDVGPGDPSSLNEPPRIEQPQELLADQPQAYEPELDAYGVPVQGRPWEVRTRLQAAASVICGVVSAVIAVTDSWIAYHTVPVWLGFVLGLVGAVLAADPLEAERKRRPSGRAQRCAASSGRQRYCACSG